jgi:acyl carrier protein
MTNQNAHLHTQIIDILDATLGLGGRGGTFTAATRLLGELPELDSFAVVQVITRLQESFGIAIEDDEIDGSIFADVGSLTAFVAGKRGAVAS